MNRTIRQSLKGRVRVTNGMLLLGAIVACASFLIWQWRSHIEFVVGGVLVMLLGASLRLRVRCPQCTHILGRPQNFCPNCGVNFDNPRY
jgi:hypothetical protein